MANTIRIKLQDTPPIKLGFSDKLVLKYVAPNHPDLDNLDYEHSGHTGFMPAKLSLLPELPKSTPNERLSLSVFDKVTNETSTIDFEDLASRVIKTVGEVPSDIQKGQYLFLQITEEENQNGK